jgi:hypothetical protein
MNDYVKQIAYSEGHYAYKDGVNCIDNPYEGVSKELKIAWEDGWWDTFYEDL